MPSGTMAQSIALLIHSQRSKSTVTTTSSNNSFRPKRFACHHTSHLLLWEENSCKELSNMDAVEIKTKGQMEGSRIHVPPLCYEDVLQCFMRERENNSIQKSMSLGEDGLSTLMIELPHRELGGKLTPWRDVLDMAKLCKDEEVKFHCDGARIFEASAGYG